MSHSRHKKGVRPLTLLDNDQVENREVSINNAASDRLAFALSPSPWAIAGVALAEEKTYTSVGQDTLLHGETLLVVSSTDADNVALRKKNMNKNQGQNSANSYTIECCDAILLFILFQLNLMA